jgi:hypothetical protein
MIDTEPPVIPIRDDLDGVPSLTLSIHCTCGASLVGRTNRVELADAVMKLFNRQHFGEGHAPTSPKRPPKSAKGPRPHFE